MSRIPEPDVTPPDLPGYRFIKLIGTGGNARVYLFEQELPRRKVAVKVLNESVQSEAARRRFIAEANVTAGLQHRHIVQLFDAKITGDGRPCLVMPYYPQPNLAQRARRSHFSVADVLRVGIQTGSAVETSHRAGVLHRDIKPQNILTDSYGEPVLTDFGIATTQGDGPEGMSVPWSPPEILFGTGPGDQRSDVYSLGATLWHLLAGRSPFEYPGDSNATPALMERIKRDPPPRTQRSDVPESLERLLWQALAKDPAARPQTTMELIHGLQSVEQELRLPVTQPVLSAGQLPTDTSRSGTLPRQAVPSDETTHRRVSGGQPDQPSRDGGYDTTITRARGTGGARPASAAADDPARWATGQHYAEAPRYSAVPGYAGRRARARSRRVLTISGGVALLAAVTVVAVLSLSPGHSDPSAASTGNVQSTVSAASTVSSAPTDSSASAPAVTAGALVVPSQTPGAATAPAAGTGKESPHSSPAVQAVPPPNPSTGVTADQSSSTATAPATTVAPPPPTVSAVETAPITCGGRTCYHFSVSAANFPANTVLSYSCSETGGSIDPTGFTGTEVTSGSTTTDGSGSTSFVTECYAAFGTVRSVTVTVSGGGQSAAGSATL